MARLWKWPAAMMSISTSCAKFRSPTLWFFSLSTPANIRMFFWACFDVLNQCPTVGCQTRIWRENHIASNISLGHYRLRGGWSTKICWSWRPTSKKHRLKLKKFRVDQLVFLPTRDPQGKKRKTSSFFGLGANFLFGNMCFFEVSFGVTGKRICVLWELSMQRFSCRNTEFLRFFFVDCAGLTVSCKTEKSVANTLVLEHPLGENLALVPSRGAAWRSLTILDPSNSMFRPPELQWVSRPHFPSPDNKSFKIGTGQVDGLLSFFDFEFTGLRSGTALTSQFPVGGTAEGIPPGTAHESALGHGGSEEVNRSCFTRCLVLGQ